MSADGHQAPLTLQSLCDFFEDQDDRLREQMEATHAYTGPKKGLKCANAVRPKDNLPSTAETSAILALPVDTLSSSQRQSHLARCSDKPIFALCKQISEPPPKFFPAKGSPSTTR